MGVSKGSKGSDQIIQVCSLRAHACVCVSALAPACACACARARVRARVMSVGCTHASGEEGAQGALSDARGVGGGRLARTGKGRTVGEGRCVVLAAAARVDFQPLRACINHPLRVGSLVTVAAGAVVLPGPALACPTARVQPVPDAPDRGTGIRISITQARAQAKGERGAAKDGAGGGGVGVGGVGVGGVVL